MVSTWTIGGTHRMHIDYRINIHPDRELRFHRQYNRNEIHYEHVARDEHLVEGLEDHMISACYLSLHEICPM